MPKKPPTPSKQHTAWRKAIPTNRFFVYHYTKVDTAIALLKGAGQDAFLRMYSSKGFNDPDEGQYPYRSTLSLQDAHAAGLLPEHQHEDEWLRRLNYAYIASFVIDKNCNTASNNIPYWIHYGDDGSSLPLPRLGRPHRNAPHRIRHRPGLGRIQNPYPGLLAEKSQTAPAGLSPAVPDA